MRNVFLAATQNLRMVGFQAEHTLGRQIENKAKEIRIFGELHPLHTFLVHGETGPLAALADGLKTQVGFERVGSGASQGLIFPTAR